MKLTKYDLIRFIILTREIENGLGELGEVIKTEADLERVVDGAINIIQGERDKLGEIEKGTENFMAYNDLVELNYLLNKFVLCNQFDTFDSFDKAFLTEAKKILNKEIESLEEGKYEYLP